MTGLPPRASALGQYISATHTRRYEDAVIHEARRALVDYLGVTVVAAFDETVQPLRKTVERWRAPGKARIVLGGTTTPALAALINATATHAMDYDDVHYLGAGHPGGPCWSTALALAQDRDFSDEAALHAFITGFEVMARLGGGGVPGIGRKLQRKGFHPTSVVGRMGAASVAAALYQLDTMQAYHALANAATTAGGLMGSFGTHGKPFHAGKAAMDGILAADVAADGYIGGANLYELENGWLDAFIQDRDVNVPPLDFDGPSQLLLNGYKLYASCRATHASSQTAQQIAPQLKGRRVERVVAKIHPGGLVTAGNPDPKTPLEAKFSIAFCIAMALNGYKLAWSDFSEAIFDDKAVTELLPKITLEPVDGQSPASAFLTVTLTDGEELNAETAVILGHPENPVSDAGLADKYRSLVEPVLGKSRSDDLLATAWRFGEPGAVATIAHLLSADS
ncbi:2-methylcitrate dehydratase PrpD [Aureimonas altamirensis DSM 21988]|uniref:2-methylcitrate dehydratase PrpD n=1 Tax=Aureimonas altamirensis DSM 21988 TaxID=1121026 RepID=A0ABY1IPL4_9HYPH|nr:MmgE/PrpD family protein [Aureimonas altamirensis]SHJ78810.1 2-methylcitrate dehydratase PrpD [Aureimonas altamirensis DSM 21988]